MTKPALAVTLDDSRYYEWPPTPGVHYPSITTVIKEGVPKPFLAKWSAKKAAELAFESLDTLLVLRELANAHE